MKPELNKLQMRKEKSVYVGKSWEDLQNLQNAGQNVLIFYYVSSCSSCKIFIPIYEKVASLYEKQDQNLIFAKIDVISFHKKLDQKQIKQYPSIQYYKYGRFLSQYEGEKDYESLIKFVKENRNPMAEIMSQQMFEEINQKEQVFSIFIGDKNSLQFQEYECTCSKFKDMGYYFVSTSNKDSEQLKEFILNQFNEFHYVVDESIILLVNSQYGKRHSIFSGHFQDKQIEEFFKKNGYSQIDVLNQRNLSFILQKNIDALVFILDDSARSKEILSYIPHLSLRFTDQVYFFTIYKKNIDQDLLRKLKGVILQKELIKNVIQLYLFRDNGKQVFQMENISSNKTNQDQVEQFILQALRGDQPKLVETEDIPQETGGPIKILVGKTFEQEVYKSRVDAIVYFKSNFIKESESLHENLVKLSQFIQQYRMESMVQIFQIDMTKNKIYSKNNQLLEDIEVLPKLYIFVADEQKYDGIKLNGKDFDFLKEVIPKLSSFNWKNKDKKTQKELEQIRVNIQKIINPNSFYKNNKKQDL